MMYDANEPSLKLQGITPGACGHESFVHTRPRAPGVVPSSFSLVLGHRGLGHVVPLKLAGVAVGGRDLNWERIPLAQVCHAVFF